MLGTLTETQIENLLTRQITGRLGCCARGKMYIVPVNYFYKNSVMYAHSGEGRKITMMRKNPEVCFQVDDIKSLFQWKSVIAWGKFEEITDPEEKQQAMQGLRHRIMPFADHPADHPSHAITDNEAKIDTEISLIVYKITLSNKTGRFEKSEGRA